MSKYDELYKAHPNAFGNGKPEGIVLEAIKHLKPGAQVIELGAGQGRNAVVVAAEGFDVLATDTSEVGVETINRLSAELNLPNLKGEMQDMQTPLEANYDLIITTFTLHFLLDTEARACIDMCKAHTNPGGLHAIIAFTQEGDFYKLPTSKDRFYLKPSEFKELYADWEILSYSEDQSRARQTKPDGSPMFNTAATILARKPL